MEKHYSDTPLGNRHCTAVTAFLSPAFSLPGTLQSRIQLSRKQVGCGAGINTWLTGVSFLSINIVRIGLVSSEILVFKILLGV